MDFGGKLELSPCDKMLLLVAVINVIGFIILRASLSSRINEIIEICLLAIPLYLFSMRLVELLRD